MFFKLQPETIHHIIVGGMKVVGYIPFAKALIKSCHCVKSSSLEREVIGLKFPNPIGLAAGFDKNAEVYDVLSCMGFGFVEIGTVTPKAQSGNPKPRMFRLPKDKAIINRMGFNNEGLKAAVRRLRSRNPKLIIGGNIGKNTTTPNEKAAEDYLKLFRGLYDYVDYFVVNVSCPNVANLTSLQSKQSTIDILMPLKEFRKGQKQYRPILLKISPDLSTEQVDTMIEVVRQTKIDGIVATNTTTSRGGLATDDDDVKRIANGGLSGAPLTERSREMVRYIHQKTGGKIAIIGVGGIMSVQDAKEMLAAGASLVQVYSGFIYEGPGFVKSILKYLK
ncbi:Dihydroorotate dehydrogenase [Mucinivorans hirudinis]|uniref:Dihydroorotate dehydrogenase (quinone) n=1 Tax=Mucinivorans hirudinis TaxID=1433126 RepID=A0A060R5Y2_9BACT|nr:Dihydroorotate dehydrogenase [Mucinivorans hirudinis]